MPDGISVIVCCFNSAARLPATLKHLALQENMQAINWEVIIVDNNSTDATAASAFEAWEKYETNTPLIIVTEKMQGLAYARQKGAEQAKYELIIFCDDDNWLQKDYIDIAFSIMASNRNIGAMGGKAEGYFETQKPGWFDGLESAYAVGTQLPRAGYANERRYITGAGMVIRKEIFTKLKTIGFDTVLTDRKKDALSSGGDSELCLLTIYLGYDLYYDDRLLLTHFITGNRLRWSYCVKLITKGFACSQIYFAMYDYCYNCRQKNKLPLFHDLYKWNKRKVLRAIWQECNGFEKIFRVLFSLLRSEPGNKNEIKIKTAINKYLYLRKNKNKIAAAFDLINNQVGRLYNYKAFAAAPSVELN